MGYLKKPRERFAIFFFLVLSTFILVSSAGAKEVKNIILMISDGQGLNTVKAADFFKGEKSVYEEFPVQYLMTTYSNIGTYIPELAWDTFDLNKLDPTDSAAAATAIATGVKTIPGIIGKNSLFEDRKNIIETVSGFNKATGVVTSVPISHATPAGMVAHNASRNNYKDISNEMIFKSDLDLIIGAGHPLYDNNGELTDSNEYKYIGGKDTFTKIISNTAVAKDKRTWTFIDLKEDFESLANKTISAEKVIGIPRVSKTLQQKRSGDSSIVDLQGKNANIPSLATLSKAALNILSNDSKDNNGLFLMIEGGAVDWASHSNQKGRVLEEQMAFNDAVKAVVEWIDTNSSFEETLLIVTADHDCGYIWGDERSFDLVGDNGPGKMPDMEFNSESHSNIPVPFYANGPVNELKAFTATLVDGRDDNYMSMIEPYNTEFDGKYIDNTDVFTIMNHFVKNEERAGERDDYYWYKGDLHAHSLDSDGDSSVEDVIKNVERLGFDYFALTDHDGQAYDQNGSMTQWDSRYKSDKVTLLYGAEWTTSEGHANVWAAEPFDYTNLWNANNKSTPEDNIPDLDLAIETAHSQDALFSINHPMAYACCPWKLEKSDKIDSIEIWNAMYHIPNLNGLASHPYWDIELRKGKRFSGVGGSDTHELKGIQSILFGHGNPTTWVYAKSENRDTVDGESVIDALKKGRVCLSYAHDGERIEFKADADKIKGYEAVIGDNLLWDGKEKIKFSVDLKNTQKPSLFFSWLFGVKEEVKEVSPEELLNFITGENKIIDLVKKFLSDDTYLLCIYKNGFPYKAWILTGGADHVKFNDNPSSRRHHYYRAELIGKQPVTALHKLLYGKVKAITNPIYVNYPAK